MKDLLQHLWRNSRLFQVVVIAGIGALAWTQFGRPSARTPPPPPDPNALAEFDSPFGKGKIPGVTEKVAKGMMEKSKDTADDILDAAKTGAGAAKEIAGGIWDGAKWVRRQVDPPAPKNTPPLDPVTPKAP